MKKKSKTAMKTGAEQLLLFADPLPTISELLEDLIRTKEELDNVRKGLFRRIGEMKSEIESLREQLTIVRCEANEWKFTASHSSSQGLGTSYSALGSHKVEIPVKNTLTIPASSIRTYLR